MRRVAITGLGAICALGKNAGECWQRLVQGQPGFLGAESTRGADGFGITVAYFDSEENIANWRAHAEHRQAQAMGRSTWYEHFELRIAKVERAHGMKPR